MPSLALPIDVLHTVKRRRMVSIVASRLLHLCGRLQESLAVFSSTASLPSLRPPFLIVYDITVFTFSGRFRLLQTRVLRRQTGVIKFSRRSCEGTLAPRGEYGNLCFLGPTRVHNPNDKSIGSAVFAQLTAECLRAHWRNLANTIEFVLPSAHPNPQPKR